MTWQHIVLFCLIFCLVGMVLFVLLSYCILKLLKLSIDHNHLWFYQYNKKSAKILEQYGDCKITNVYLIRQQFSKIITFLLNLITLYNYEKLIAESQDNFPYHTLLVFELALDKDKNKKIWVSLEKNNCIQLTDTFLIHKAQEVWKLTTKQKTHSLRSVLDATQRRMGNEKYFNWHIYKNNCQEFTKEVLKTLGQYNKKTKHFILRDKLYHLLSPSEFTLHITNCMCVLYNIAEKYVLGV